LIATGSDHYSAEREVDSAQLTSIGNDVPWLALHYDDSNNSIGESDVLIAAAALPERPLSSVATTNDDDSDSDAFDSDDDDDGNGGVGNDEID
jgi:hypothetical protein